MIRPGSSHHPLRVAVVGSGPAGFYTIQHLFQQKDLEVRADLFERLETPFGLVRFGVAPDHPKIKSVTAVYEKLARNPGFRFFGNVEFGSQLRLAELQRHYHQIVFCTGAQTDRRLGIPGEDLNGSHAATDFVAWYNGHPDFSHLEFDLDCESAMVVGVGNVAADVARILTRSPEELATTDIADYALDALRRSRVRVVHLVGRRGPVQAAFTNPEIKELGELADCETSTRSDEMELDALSAEALAAADDKATPRKVELLQSYNERRRPECSRKLILRFLASPAELLGDDAGRVRAVRLVRNELYTADDGSLRPRPTDRFETVDAGLVFRSVGYRGVALADLPFNERWGVLPNEAGRIVDPETLAPLTGLYTSGWIKRGPSGVIGTNKADAHETVECMLEDLREGRLLEPEQSDTESIADSLDERGARVVTYDDWKQLDALEVAQGKAQGRPRVKITDHAGFMRALGR
jgi:ferredoxin--NADP+ reductase